MTFDIHPAWRQPRVLIMTDVTAPGGVGTAIGQLALFGRRQGWNVLVYMDDGNGSDLMAHMLQQIGVSVMRGSLYRGYHADQTIREAVWAALERHQPDVVHVQCGSPRSAVLPRELIVDAGLPLIVTENFVSADLEIPNEILQRIRTLYRHAFAVIAVCGENLKLLRETFGLYARRSLVIRNGVALPPTGPRDAISPSRFKAITVARLSPQKAVDVLIQAVAMLPHDVRKMFQFTIAGNGEEERRLKQMSDNLCLTECINFVGWSNDVAALLRTHDLFILPSVAEGQPISLMEALAAGLPCIASSVSGIPEVLGEGEYGTLVTPKDPQSLSAAIVDFGRNPSILRQKALAARDYLRKNHDPDKNMGQIVGLWNAATVSHSVQSMPVVV